MAKDVTSSTIWKFDAVDQYEGLANVGETSDGAPIFNVPIYVDWIQYESAGTGGSYEVRVSDDGPPIHGPITLGANASLQLAVGGYVDGVYIEAFGSDGQILIKTGRD